jgi:hypothetical protein
MVDWSFLRVLEILGRCKYIGAQRLPQEMKEELSPRSVGRAFNRRKGDKKHGFTGPSTTVLYGNGCDLFGRRTVPAGINDTRLIVVPKKEQQAIRLLSVGCYTHHEDVLVQCGCQDIT